ncbi:uncharacterized protein LOC105445387 [Strongylocentrotus purpuratus]|uniref:Uncharacterized protein n=1 Tax=Strongylocentrotus purpuratus TaxID=7668 RepID=A0A7M7LTR6_STRPU|nr:uncharacterized protein LOC105445387 [Strongylocentrotus purpuratus]
MMAYNSRSRLSRKEDSLELVPLQKKVSVVVCSCSHSNNVEGLIQLIRQHMNDVVETVRYEFLPYNIRDMNKFDLSGIDVLLLCHSIENRRFSITNVTDALYDGFLPRARKHLGQSKVGVIAHDFPEGDISSEKLSSKMDSFRHTQSTTFESASLVLIGGKLINDEVQLNDEQLEELQEFFSNASSPPAQEVLKVWLHKAFHFFTCNLLVNV